MTRDNELYLINSFTIRVYAICIRENKLLVLHEKFMGKDIIKFAGGGMEFGEGTLDCIKRELKEELNLNVKSAQHFYTQEDFVQSAVKKNQQLMTIYYKVEVENWDDMKINDPDIQSIEWLPIQNENPFVLPVDRLVFDKLKLSQH